MRCFSNLFQFVLKLTIVSWHCWHSLPTGSGEYELTIPPHQFESFKESGFFGSHLTNYKVTAAGDYKVTLTTEQYTGFQKSMGVGEGQEENGSTNEGQYFKHPELIFEENIHLELSRFTNHADCHSQGVITWCSLHPISGPGCVMKRTS